MEDKKELLIVLAVYLCYAGINLLSNFLMQEAVSTQNQMLESISGILLGFVSIPIFSIILPFWFAKKWNLPSSFWPKTKNWVLVVSFMLLYVFVSSFEMIKSVMKSGISLQEFVIHLTSASLFHVTYYPLFAIFMFPVFREKFGLIKSLILTSFAFSFYHLFQFYYFPAGLTPMMQLVLFSSFLISLVFYLWSESLILVALMHTINGALGLISNGTVFKEIDFVFYLTLVIAGSLFAYMIQQEYVQRKKKFDKNWWLNFSIKDH